MKTLATSSFWALGILMLIFGMNKFIGFIPVGPPADPTAQHFMGAMFGSYLFTVVAVAEIVGGVLLFKSATRLIGWLLLAPIVFNIVAFHLAHDFIGNGLWIIPAGLFLVTAYFLRGEKFEFLRF